MNDNLLAEWARLLFGSLLAAGLRDVVVSPGSRSTPFAFAALSTPGLRCHSVLDERAAGFFALGQARATGRPSALLSTSGSAVANYFPAVAEAAYAHLPLLVLSADRPFELQDVGAAQCMDQVKLFGGMVRAYLDPGQPESSEAALGALQRLALRAVEAALGPSPGPVHVNLRAKKPLEPQPARSDGERALVARVDRRLSRGAGRLARSPRALPEPLVHEVAERCARHERGLLVLGPLASAGADPGAVLELGAALGFPICAEAASQVRFGFASGSSGPVPLGGLDALLGAPGLAPDFVLQLGGTPTSAAYERFTREARVERVVIAPHGFPDPSGCAELVLEAEPWAFARALAKTARVSRSRGRSEFGEAWRQADATYFRLAAELGSGSALDEPAAVRAALAALPPVGGLALGNSLPIRDVDAFVPPRAGSLRVWSQRGLNGIDGLVSGAIGAAGAAGIPSLALIGDVSFLHDLGGLSLGRSLAAPLALVVIDNGGGRIFEHLPLASLLAAEPSLARFWTTPQTLELRHAAALFELGFASPESPSELELAVRTALERPGCTLIHARVPADSARLAALRLREQLARELT